MKPLIWKMPSGRYLLIENYAFKGTSTTEITVRGETKDITEEVQRIDAEARADEARKDCEAMCERCAAKVESQRFPEKHPFWFWHRVENDLLLCTASPIHERQAVLAGKDKP